MRRWVVAIALLAGVLSLGRAEAADVPAKVGPVVFSRAVERLPAGTAYITLKNDNVLLCTYKGARKADGTQKPIALDVFGPIFVREMSAALNPFGATNTSLFDQDAAEDDASYEVGAVVHGMNFDLCASETGYTKGSGRLDIRWQVFSRAKRAVITTIETSGSYEAFNRKDRRLLGDMINFLAASTFAENVKQLAAAPEFKAVLAAAASKDERQSNPGRQDRIVAQTGQPTPRPIADAIGAVVLISTPGGDGSGVLISTDGLVLTDAHVVELDQSVKIRWSDGYEAPGQVVRVHKKRDVALVKTDPHGRTPLPIRTSAVQVGDPVLAIGAPLFKELQGTVTRGIVSAHRIKDGFAFIQSDVAINRGNSGGPLLDDKGYVIGLSDLSLQPSYGVQIGINYFTPIQDALDFLSLDLVAKADAPAVEVSAPATSGRVSKR